MNQRDLTSRQIEVLDFLHGFIQSHGYAPSIREIMKGIGVNSLRGVTIHLDTLERKGFISREKGQPRCLKIHLPSEQVPMPISGTVTQYSADGETAYVTVRIDSTEFIQPGRAVIIKKVP